MNLRAPAIPLINVDPYFSIWSMTDNLNDSAVNHWTCKPNTINGIVSIDGNPFRFMGVSDIPAIKQISLDINTLSTFYSFANEQIELNVVFTSPLLPADFDLLSRPVTYMKTSVKILDGKEHDVKVKVSVSEELCLNLKGEGAVSAENVDIDNIKCMRLGSTDQKPLNKSGDNIRINWGYVYLAVKDGSAVCSSETDDMTYISIEADANSLFMFAYDDIYSIEYFHEPLKAYWKRDGKTIEEAIEKAADDYGNYLFEACEDFSRRMFCDAVRAGGEKYAELLELAYRQVIAAHKMAVDSNGEILFISKECTSNGCAATVDVSYPSIPLFLIYAPELVKGMMRPIFKYAAGGVWCFDFAPHDAGQYPLLNGQVYSKGIDPEHQMPVEECGNMLIMAAAVSVADGNAEFAGKYMPLLTKWVRYLVEFGSDPGDQLCTDDFAGHLAHNCNLSIKAIMGIAGYSIINRMLGNTGTADEYFSIAEDMAAQWCITASNGDGSYRLAFDRPDTYSMKYNAVWDKLFGTNIFPAEVLQSELASNFRHFNPYGMVLDNRASYTKSDWTVWTATMLNDKADFIRYTDPLWKTYNYSPSRVPMNDWFDTATSIECNMHHRSVQGGLYIKLLEYTKKMRLK